MSSTQSIDPKILESAAQAFGGQPVRPPKMQTVPIASPAAKAPPVPTGDAKARESFAAKQQEPEAPATGNPTFDAPASELVERRANVAGVRQRLGALIAHIANEHRDLMPKLTALEADAPALKSAEAFDPGEARQFLADLQSVVDGLAPKAPAKPKAKD